MFLNHLQDAVASGYEEVYPPRPSESLEYMMQVVSAARRELAECDYVDLGKPVLVPDEALADASGFELCGARPQAAKGQDYYTKEAGAARETHVFTSTVRATKDEVSHM